jgi:hypothetical protein
VDLHHSNWRDFHNELGKTAAPHVFILITTKKKTLPNTHNV